MEKVIYNNWQQISPGNFQSLILRRDVHPEGLDVSRYSFKNTGKILLNPNDGHIISVLAGRVDVKTTAVENALRLESSVHCYFPPDQVTELDLAENTQLIHVAGPGEQTRGKMLLIRDEQFLRAAANETHSFRWILTPQYLSRRIFLHHDQVLLSRQKNPIGWFHTTMFDVNGLPQNDDGISVFKMQYDYQTEPNICYDVAGRAKVRMALHPYTDNGQLWADWRELNSDSTYHLNEAVDAPEVEWFEHSEDGGSISKRNKHEVYIPEGGHVTLCCMFDPAPTGTEKHKPGKYSAYDPVSKTIHTAVYQEHLKNIKVYDEMIDELSFLKACGRLSENNHPRWPLFRDGLKNQLRIEMDLVCQLRSEGKGRDLVVLPWTNKGK